MSGAPPVAVDVPAAGEAEASARLRHYLWSQRRSYAFGLLCLLCTNLCLSFIPQTTKEVFDLLDGAHAEADVVTKVRWLALRLVLLAIGMGVFRVASRVFIFNGGRECEHSLRRDVYEHLQRLSPTFFGRIPVGDLVSRITNDITAVRLLGGPGLLNVVNTAIVYVTAAGPMILLDAPLAAAALSPLLLVFVVTRRVSRDIYDRSIQAQAALSQVSALANESITGIHVVQGFAAEGRRQELFADASQAYREAYLAWTVRRSVLIPILAGMGGLGTLVLLVLGGQRVIAGTLSLGSFVAMMAYLAMLMWPTVALGWMISMWQRGRAAMVRLTEILATEPDVTVRAPASGAPPLTDVRGQWSIRGLDFAWPGREDHPVLRCIDLDIRPGERILVVGPSGAGKTTLVTLLPHLVAVPEGRIFLDGHDLTTVPLSVLRRRIAFVPQDPFLFGMTVAENIGFGLPEPDEAAVRRAAELCCLTAEIAQFPQGLQTEIGERGHTVSGGQRQRLTIARAAVLDPAMWIFDDCLSSVDAETEQRIVRALLGLTRSQTAIFVTHRVLGWEGVDRVVVLEDGRITEQGTHDELLNRGQWYANLYRMQRMEQALRDA